MQRIGQHSVRDRIGSALGAALVQVLIGLVFIWGMGVDMRTAVEDPLKLFDVAPPPAPPQPIVSRPPPRVASEQDADRYTPREEGGSSPPNIRSKATEIVAPSPEVRLPLPSPVVAAPIANIGRDPSTGAADIRGPGTGSGGYGDGYGSGMGGYGGGGGGYGGNSPPRRIRGRIRNSDFPREAWEVGAGGTVSIIYAVTVDGRATDCRITRSSGSAVLDFTTCRLVEERFRFDPSRDWRGRPVRSRIEENHSWMVEDLPRERRRGW